MPMITPVESVWRNEAKLFLNIGVFFKQDSFSCILNVFALMNMKLCDDIEDFIPYIFLFLRINIYFAYVMIEK